MSSMASDRSKNRDTCQQLVCDPKGVIVAEVVYRCLCCDFISDLITTARDHYWAEHGSKEEADLELMDADLEEEEEETKAIEGPEEEVEAEPLEVLSTNPFTKMKTSSGKSGSMLCIVCGLERYYLYLQKRLGKEVCPSCYRFFREFTLSPTPYSCQWLGSCSLKVRRRCRACWLKASFDAYSGSFGSNDDRQLIIDRYYPLKTVDGREEDDDVVGENQDDKDGPEQEEEEEAQLSETDAVTRLSDNPYKRMYFNWRQNKSPANEKVISHPAISHPAISPT